MEIPPAFGADGGSDASGSAEDSRQPTPQRIKGIFFSKTAHQFFARTNPILSYGMCGGPVTANDRNTLTAGGVSKTSVTSSVCGMLEGIVPLESTNENIRGLASFVDSPNILE